MLEISNADLNISDIIQLIGIIATSLTSIIAIIISVVSLRQNSKMIEESSRPNIGVYIDSTNFSQPIIYLVIKNFGNSASVITEFKCDIDLSEFAYIPKAIPFNNIVGTTLNPNQKLVYPLKPRDSNNIRITDMNIKVSYKTFKRKYSENIFLNLDAYFNEMTLRSYDKNEPIKSISYAVQDISEKML